MNKPNEYPISDKFHHIGKGCDMEDAEIPGERSVYMFHCQRCKTHNVITCRCGWEYGWHGGTNNRVLSDSLSGRPPIVKRKFKLRELAKLYGVSTSTISRRLKSGEIKYYEA